MGAPRQNPVFSLSPQVPYFIAVETSDSLPPSYCHEEISFPVCATITCSNMGQLRLTHSASDEK